MDTLSSKEQLYDPARHEPLEEVSWSGQEARRTIEAIVADTEAACIEGQWADHPLDASFNDKGPFSGLYLGAAGNVLALQRLRRRGYGGTLDLPAVARGAATRFRTYPDGTTFFDGLMVGTAGVEWVHWWVARTDAALAALTTAVDTNESNATNEIFMGREGTALAALHMYRETGDDAWKTRYLRAMDLSWQAWTVDPEEQLPLWVQSLIGFEEIFYGAAHGLVGNAMVFLAGEDLLDEERREELHKRIAHAVVASAEEAEGMANWPSNPGRPPDLLQWCHGAPGTITCLAGMPSGECAALDAVLEAGAALIWHAGPVKKGISLCHGTAGNGAALLSHFVRTQKPAWLERARAFAMHAIGQAERLRQEHGRRRHSAWTGDLGLALFLADCIDGCEPWFPGLSSME